MKEGEYVFSVERCGEGLGWMIQEGLCRVQRLEINIHPVLHHQSQSVQRAVCAFPSQIATRLPLPPHVTLEQDLHPGYNPDLWQP